MYKGIANKKDSYALYDVGELGNKLRSWPNYTALCKIHYSGTLTLRYAGTDSNWCKYRVAREDVNDLLVKWRDEGADMTKVKFSESAPDHHLVIQGEIQEHPEHKYVLSYSTKKVTMREAMRHPENMLGTKALYLLQEHFSLESMRNLKRLFATYPLAVVEFSTYDHMLGNIPENNTVFWEVRNY